MTISNEPTHISPWSTQDLTHSCSQWTNRELDRQESASVLA